MRNFFLTRDEFESFLYQTRFAVYTTEMLDFKTRTFRFGRLFGDF